MMKNNDLKEIKTLTERRQIGNTGESIACKFLVKRGYKIIARNYWRKWGEIDVVAENKEKLLFVEVKTVSCEMFEDGKGNVSCEKFTDGYRPEDNVHPWKLKRLSRIIQSYLAEKGVSDETRWQFDVITVYLDQDKKMAKVKVIEDIVL